MLAKNGIFEPRKASALGRKKLLWEGWHPGTDASVTMEFPLWGSELWRDPGEAGMKIRVRAPWTHNAPGLHLAGVLAWDISMATVDTVRWGLGVISICRTNFPEQLQKKQTNENQLWHCVFCKVLNLTCHSMTPILGNKSYLLMPLQETHFSTMSSAVNFYSSVI